MIGVKAGSWLEDLIAVYNRLGGQAHYSSVYPLAEKFRKYRGASWTAKSKQTIQRTVESHARSSGNFKGKEVFYSVNGHGKGVWALMPDFLVSNINEVGETNDDSRYLQGQEGILREANYLRRSRDPRLVEERKKLDNYTCQVCDWRVQVSDGAFVIDVHHLQPIGNLSEPVITTIEDLVSLCPSCHRVAHTGSRLPRSLDEIRSIIPR